MFKGDGCDLWHSPGETKESHENLVRIADNAAQIRTGYHPNTPATHTVHDYDTSLC